MWVNLWIGLEWGVEKQNLGVEVSCTAGMAGITEDEYFESERGKGQF